MYMNKIQDKGGAVYDMHESSDVLNYLILTTSSFVPLINYSLFHLMNNTLLDEFYNEFQKGDIEYRYAYCHYPIVSFRDLMIDREDQFTFSSYLFENPTISEPEKISKITALYTRIKKVLGEVTKYIDIKSIKNLSIGREEKSLNRLKPLVLICPNYNGELIKIEGIFLKMLYSATGIVLSDIQVKMENELSGFLNHQVNKAVTAPLSNNRKSREEIVGKLIGIDTRNYSTFQKYESKLIDYGYLSEARNEWNKNAASFVRFYTYCEKNKIFPDFYKTSTKGISLLRELYTFYKGKDLNPPSKRKKQSTPSTKGEFAFLDLY